MKLKQQGLDLTQGIIWRQLLLFFIPILAGSIIQQLYTTLDAVIVGQFAGKTGLAAIDSVYNLLKLPVNFFVGLSTGATIIISQLFGGLKERELSRATHTAAALALVGGVILSITGILIAPCCLRMMAVPDDIFSLTLSYVRIYFGGMLFSLLYNVGAGILRAVGDSQTPLYVLVAACITNVVLDLLLVGVFQWSVAGAALSTVAAQLLSAVLVLAALARTKNACRLDLSQLKFHRDMLKPIFKVGLPVGLQSSLYPIANMMIQASINSTGTDNIAAWALCGKLDFLIWLIADSLAAAVATFVAQNYGAKKYVRIRKVVWTGLGMTAGMVGLIAAVLFFRSGSLGKLFINAADYNILPLMEQLMHFLAPLYFLYVFGEVFSGAIRGAGETLKPMVLTLIGTCATRILWILLVVPENPTVMVIIGSYPASWLLTGIFFTVFYLRFRVKKFPV